MVLPRSGIAAHVDGMVDILRDEASKASGDGIPGECIEFVLESNIVQLLFLLGKDDVRSGLLHANHQPLCMRGRARCVAAGHECVKPANGLPLRHYCLAGLLH